MTALATIAGIKARRITASSITTSELMDLVDAAERTEDADAKVAFWEGVAERQVDRNQRTRLRAALRLSVLEAALDAANDERAEALRTVGDACSTIATLRAQVEGLRASPSHPEPYASATLNALFQAFDAIERDPDGLTIEVTRGGVVWWYGTEEVPDAQGSAAGLRAALLAAGDKANPSPARMTGAERGATQCEVDPPLSAPLIRVDRLDVLEERLAHLERGACEFWGWAP